MSSRTKIYSNVYLKLSSGFTYIGSMLGRDPLKTCISMHLVSGLGKALSSSVSQSSLRGAFPECILEDSGFEEPQEFRMRCSSLAGNLQRKPGESVIMGPTRRRHASAPNHVQPSDADKNRTMLFQVRYYGKI